ncbi:MAG: hypothetical protein IJ190_12805 [Prevotella sp.]|nr:hypothetical protein [Prevotella sp.]
MNTNYYYIITCFSRLALLLLAAVAMCGKLCAQGIKNGGEYYLRNVATGKWLGPDRAWGSQASLRKHPAWVKLHQSGSNYKMESQVANGPASGNYWFANTADNPYFDRSSSEAFPLTFTNVYDNYYTINYNGTYYGNKGDEFGVVIEPIATGNNYNPSRTAYYWQKYNYYNMYAALVTWATESYVMDATFLIGDPGFSMNNRDASRWTMTATNQTLSGGSDDNRCAESWHANYTLTQTIEHVPNGTYRLRAQGFYRQDGTDNEHLPVFYARSGETEVTKTFPVSQYSESNMNEASVRFSSGEYTIDYLEIEVSDHTLTIGSRLEENTTLWCIWDNFTLEYLGGENESWLTTWYTNYYHDEGHVYYRNLATNKWLGVEGTKAVMTEHPQYILQHEVGTKFTIETELTGSNFLGGDATQPTATVASDVALQWDIIALDDYTYIYQFSYNGNIYGSDGTTNHFAVPKQQLWQVYSRAEMDAQVMKATEGNPEDATYFIVDPNIDRNHRYASSWEWTLPEGVNVFYNVNNGDVRMADYLKDNNNYIQIGNAQVYRHDFQMSQTITNVPNGVYKLRAQGFYRAYDGANEAKPYLFINGAKTEFPLLTDETLITTALASDAFSNEQFYTDKIRVVVTNGTITLGAELEGGNDLLWVCLDNFELEYLGNPMQEPITAGVYYLRNIGAPEGNNWLSAGTRYGTRASLLKHPQYVRLGELSDGTFTMEGHVQGSGVYMGNDPYNPMMDYGTPFHLTITPAFGGYYTISNGDLYYGYSSLPKGTVIGTGKTMDDPIRVYPVTPGSDGSYWEILTHQQMIDHMLTGTALAPQDGTWLIKDFDFGLNNRFQSSWQGINNVTLGPADSVHVSHNLEAYMKTFDVHQTLMGIPNGKYKVRAQAAVTYHDNRKIKNYNGSNAPVVYANSSTVDFIEMVAADQLQSQAKLAKSFEAGSYWTAWIEVEITDNTLTIGAKSTREDIWAVWDNFELYYIGPLTDENTQDAYNADTSTSTFKVTHRQSYLAERANSIWNNGAGVKFPTEFLQPGDGWKSPYKGTGNVQNTSENITIHYVKPGEMSPVFLTTTNKTDARVLHKYYQRWYYFDESGNEKPLSTAMMAPEFYGYQYQNGLVMGTQLVNRISGVAEGHDYSTITSPVNFSLLLALPKGMQSIAIAGDMSRYSDMTYATSGAASVSLAGNLEEPSLTMRHIFELRDAKEMAAQLTAKKGDEWLEKYEIHFPSRTITRNRADHVPLSLELRDYWFFLSGDPDSNSDDDLQNIINDEFITVSCPEGEAMGFSDFRMVLAPNNDRPVDMSIPYTINNTEMLRRRLIEFTYPVSGEVPGGSRMDILVKAHNPLTDEDYNLAKFTIVFNEQSETLPWMDVVGDESKDIEATRPERDPKNLRDLVGGRDPVAHIDFDYPQPAGYETFVLPNKGYTNFTEDGQKISPERSFPYTSPLPLDFDRTNYSFATLENDNLWWTHWGDYSIGSETYNGTAGIQKYTYPVTQKTGYQVNPELTAGFLYLDASDLPGTVATIPFEGELCPGSKLMCTGWITSRVDQEPASVILKVIGHTDGQPDEEIYAFCPGSVGSSYRRDKETSLTASSGEFCWQQFYFTFYLPHEFDSYSLRIENNCRSTEGADYFLDDIWVFSQVPTVAAERTSPLCGGGLELVQLEIDYDSLLGTIPAGEAQSEGESEEGYLSFICVDWDKFLNEFRTGLSGHSYTIDETTVQGSDLTTDQLVTLLNTSEFSKAEYNDLYKTSFQRALMTNVDGNVAYGNYKWYNYFERHEEYTFQKIATAEDHSVIYRDGEGENRRLIFNGVFSSDMAIENFEFFHNYALLALYRSSSLDIGEKTPEDFVDDTAGYLDLFDIRSLCSSRSMLYFRPKTQILGTTGAMAIDEVEFCKDTDLTFGVELAGIEKDDGKDVVMQDVYFDWWVGTANTKATIENYQNLTSDGGVSLQEAIKNFRLMNPDATSLFSDDIKLGKNSLYSAMTEFTQEMLDYLRELSQPADGSDPQLIIHQKIVKIRATSDNVEREDGKDYLYFIAIPIEEHINEAAKKDYVYFCAEPVPFRVLVNQHAPTVREGFSSKTYPAGLGTLSIRIAKSQFEKVNYGGSPYTDPSDVTTQFRPMLHIPLRDVNVSTNAAIGVKDIGTEQGNYVRLVSTTDGIMEKYITDNTHNLLAPPVGVVDYFYALKDANYNTGDNNIYKNRLAKIHFTPDFKVREGYSYTLRIYYEEMFGTTTQQYVVTDGYILGGAETTLTHNTGENPTDVTLIYGADNKWEEKDNKLDANMQHYVIGGSNPKDNSNSGYKKSDSTPKLPVSGTYYKFVPNSDGYIKAGIVLNDGKSLFVIEKKEEEEAVCINDQIIITDKEGTVKYLTPDDKVSEKLYGFVQFPVKANSTYYMLSSGSKLGFYGFYFNADGFPVTCEGTMDVILKIVPDYEVWTGGSSNTDWNNDENWRRADYDELYAGNGASLKDKYMPNGDPETVGEDNGDAYNYVTKGDRERRQGFAPLYCTNILMLTKENVPASELYDAPLGVNGFPLMRETSSPLIRYDFQAREWNATLESEASADKQSECYYDEDAGVGDLVTELYSSNVCDKIAFQPETELVKAHYLTYNKAWIEYALSKNKWHLLSSPLQDMLSGEWYAPTGTARQETTYYEDVVFNTTDYDRFSPAVYQRSWDKAKAVLYERGAVWDSTDGSQTVNLGSGETGEWQATDGRDFKWVEDDGLNADDYLRRLTYKPIGNSKANVAVKGTWSGVYNDHTVRYSDGGFSVLPINNLKETSDDSTVKTVFRLPKEDTFYEIWDWNQSYKDVGDRVHVDIVEDDAPVAPDAQTVYLPHRGKLRSDALKAGASYTITLKNEGGSKVGYFLVANPFICGLDMERFFAENTSLVPAYLTLKDEDEVASTNADVTTTLGGASWKWTDMSFRGGKNGEGYMGNMVMPARYAFFVKAPGSVSQVDVTFTADMMVAGRENTSPVVLETIVPESDHGESRYLNILAERDGNTSEARVYVSETASNTFKVEEDLETFVVEGVTNDIPVVYTLTGRLATSVNRLHDFRSLPIGIESNSYDAVTLTFTGVETLGQELRLYDALEQQITPLKEGSKVRVPGSTQNRYYIVTGPLEEAVAESNIQVIPHVGGARVLSTTTAPLTYVAAYDLGGRLLYRANPGVANYEVPLPKGVAVVKAATEKCQVTKKVLVE